MNNSCKENNSSEVDWDAPTTSNKNHRFCFKTLGWFVPGWGAFFFIMYPIAKHIGFWTSSIPGAFLLGSFVGVFFYIVRSRKYRSFEV